MEPVAEGRLFKVEETVEARHEPVAAGQHFARDLGVAGFVGHKEGPQPQGRKIEKQIQAADQKNGDKAGDGRCPGRGAHRNSFLVGVAGQDVGPCTASQPARPGAVALRTGAGGK